MDKKAPLHINGHLHVSGSSKFIGDEVKLSNMLSAKIFASSKAHAKILSLNIENAKKVNGVHAIVTHMDIPGVNQIGHPVTDQPLLAIDEVVHVGQPIAIVIANTEKMAEKACDLIDIKYKDMPALLSIDDAVSANSYLSPERKIEFGDLEKAWEDSGHMIEGEVETGVQEHFYFETQRAWAVPGQNREMTLYSSTQSPSDVQRVVAKMLGVASKDVTVDVKHLGGAFGGKENSAADVIAGLAALAACKTKRPVELKLTRLEDMAWTGKRHPFLGRYKIGFNKNGKILGYDVKLYANGGAFADLSMAILERAMLHAENSYFIPNIKILGYVCKTNLPANTAFRGFGVPQGIFIIEHALERIACKLGLDPVAVRELNLYKDGDVAPYGQIVHEACHSYLFERLKDNSCYFDLQNETQEFNKNNRYIKRGISVVPVKFGISFTASFLNQGSSLIWIYSDGSISLSHGGIEMGQEINTKVAQVVASELGVDLKNIKVETANTKRVGNTSPTAASSGSDINGNAALNAARKLKQRLKLAAIEYFKEKHNCIVDEENIVFADNKIVDIENSKLVVSFSDLAAFARLKQVDLGAHGFYKTPGLFFDRENGTGNPFYYYVFGVCLVQVEVDILTGKHRLLKVYVVHENAKPINRDIDKEQITGGFFQGYGWSTMEEIPYDSCGRYLAITPSTYKIPAIRNLPEVFNIDMLELKREHASVFGSKAVGEPPFIYGEAAYFAIKNALRAINDQIFEVDLAMPATPEAIALTANKLITEGEDNG